MGTEFEQYRGTIFGLAYRMLGSASDAEEIAQETYLRWHGAQRATIKSPAAWLTKVATNLCLNRLTSASARRDCYVGPWLPEPVLTDDGVLGPLDTAELRDSVSLAFLVLLEQLNPTERAVFVLRAAFGYSHREIAETVGVSEANSRQLYQRSRQRLPAVSTATPATPEQRKQHRALVEQFLAAAQEGDLPGLEKLMAQDVTSWADGGGKVTAARRPVFGVRKVARYLGVGLSRYPVAVHISVGEVNGEPAVLGWAGDALLGVLVPHIVDGHIARISIVANPEKLAFATRQLSRPAGLSGS